METLRDRSAATQKTLQKLGDALTSEAEAWRTWAADRARKSVSDLRELLAPRTLERAVLVQADQALSAVEGRVKSRIAALDAPRKKRPAKKRAPVKGRSPRRRSAASQPA